MWGGGYFPTTYLQMPTSKMYDISKGNVPTLRLPIKVTSQNKEEVISQIYDISKGNVPNLQLPKK